ncbi:glycine zipper 2TM domain-containing protein [Brevundimonas sp. AJA228-03]|nr:glycine zipper 2TM domain-containing protein [Brevundimonas sp. AJA228-03]
MPAAASAQSYGYGNGYQNQGYSQPYGNTGYRDRCQTLSQGRTGAGALIGAGVGAVAGSQIAARGNRTEGSIIGGVLGAIIGSQVGRASNSTCQSSPYQGSAYAPPATYYDERDRYDDRAQSYGRYDDRRNDARRHDSRREDRRYDNGYQVSADGYYIYDPRRGWVPR